MRPSQPILTMTPDPCPLPQAEGVSTLTSPSPRGQTQGEAAKPKSWAGLTLDRPRVMGILNVTPDSFSDGGRHADPAAAIDAGVAMIAAGADISTSAARAPARGPRRFTRTKSRRVSCR